VIGESYTAPTGGAFGRDDKGIMKKVVGQFQCSTDKEVSEDFRISTIGG
jgi:hypothetical protein